MKLYPCFGLGRQIVEVAMASLRASGLYKNVFLENGMPECARLFADISSYQEAFSILLAHAAANSPSGGSVRVFQDTSSPTTLVIEYRSSEDIGELNDNLVGGKDQPAAAEEDEVPISRASEILLAHGGDVSAVSTIDGKTAIRIRLPEERPRILVVEDDEDYMLLISEHLQTVEGDVVMAQNGLEALKMIVDFAPHIVIMDLSMPSMDGYSLLTAMRLSKKAAEMPIIIFSSDDSLHTKNKVLEMGADKFMPKPDGLNQMAGMVISLLHSRRA